jgi:hypothetical protein
MMALFFFLTIDHDFREHHFTVGFFDGIYFSE